MPSGHIDKSNCVDRRPPAVGNHRLASTFTLITGNYQRI